MLVCGVWIFLSHVQTIHVCALRRFPIAIVWEVEVALCKGRKLQVANFNCASLGEGEEFAELFIVARERV